jgi:hypothetical protein
MKKFNSPQILKEGKTAKISGSLTSHEWKTAKISFPLISLKLRALAAR